MCDSTSELPLTTKNAPGCSCCGTGTAEAAEAAEPAGNVNLQVEGMTCGHCVSSVTEELEEVEGVRDVSVNLDPNGTSTVTVDTDSGVDPARLRAAVADAGYQVTAS